MMIPQTFNALTVLRAMLSGYAVELLGEKFAYDEETRRIGVMSQNGDEKFIVFGDIDLNRFLSMCEQVDAGQIKEMLAVLQHSAHSTVDLSGMDSPQFH